LGTQSKLLLSYGAVAVHPLALMEVVMHHALSKQKKDDCQEDGKQEFSGSERGWLLSPGNRRIRIGCHHSFLSTESEVQKENGAPMSLHLLRLKN